MHKSGPHFLSQLIYWRGYSLQDSRASQPLSREFAPPYGYGVPYVSEGLWRGFVFSRLAASAAAHAANADLPNGH